MKQLNRKLWTACMVNLILSNLQVINCLLCYSCFQTPNDIYPNIGPCPPTVEPSLMNIVDCDDVYHSCVLYTIIQGNLDVPISAGCSYRRIENTNSYIRNCANGKCENFCSTDYCKYKWT